MISLPFHKWKLNFYNSELESECEIHQNNVRLISFQMLNLFISIAGLVCLITFVIQEQPIQLIILMIGIVGGCFFMLIISKKIQPYLKHIFSLYYVWSQFSNILIAYSGLNIPTFVQGFNTCCIALVTMQYCDNRLKLVFTIITPFILLAVFDNYKASQIGFIIQSIACIICIGIQTFMYEYTSRLAFSLNLIANKQKELINEYVNDAMFAISLDVRTRQFKLEFQNKKFEEYMNIKETEKMKIFLRKSHLVIKQTKDSKKKLNEKVLQKGVNLEEFLFRKFNIEVDPIQKDIDDIIEIIHQNFITGDMMKLKIQFQQMNFGKPILIGIIKSEQVSNLIGEHEKQIQDYQRLIIKFSTQVLSQQENLYRETKKKRIINTYGQESIQSLKSLNLSIINYIRNILFYFQRDKIFTQIQMFEKFQLYEYIQSIQKYFHSISTHYQMKLYFYNLVDKNCYVNVNSKYLTQLLINIFEDILKQSNSINNVIFRISEELVQKDQIIETKRKAEDSQSDQKYIINQKLIEFQFLINSSQALNLSFIDFSKLNKKIEYQENYIVKEVTKCLLCCLGPTNTIQMEINESLDNGNFKNIFSFKIYSDQSQLDLSYIKVIDKPVIV